MPACDDRSILGAGQVDTALQSKRRNLESQTLYSLSLRVTLSHIRSHRNCLTVGAVSRFLFTAGQLKLKSVCLGFYFSISKGRTLTVK